MKKILILFFLCFFVFSQRTNATPVDIIKKKATSEETVQTKKKKKKKRFLSRMTERIMKRRLGKMLKKLKVSSKECDRIITLDGEEFDVKIVKIGEERIRYKKCDFLNGPTHTIRKEDIFMIKYSDGTKDVITDINALKKNKKEAIKVSEEKVDNATGYWIIGFLLGAMLGLLGLLFIALILNGQKRKRAFQGALTGMLAILILALVVISILLPLE